MLFRAICSKASGCAEAGTVNHVEATHLGQFRVQQRGLVVGVEARLGLQRSVVALPGGYARGGRGRVVEPLLRLGRVVL